MPSKTVPAATKIFSVSSGQSAKMRQAGLAGAGEIPSEFGIGSLRDQAIGDRRSAVGRLPFPLADLESAVGNPGLTEVATQIKIFPPELRGAGEGSSMMDAAPGSMTHSRMTNGSVSRSVSAMSHSRMTNGTVQKGNGTALVVHYENGAETISVPVGVPVTQVVPGVIPTMRTATRARSLTVVIPTISPMTPRTV
jgi:hypothetical protein